MGYMTGSASFAHSADAAGEARELLDSAAEAARTADTAQRDLLASLVELWPTSAWIAAGATSAKRWLVAYTGCSEQDAHRLERLAGLCHRHPSLADAVLSGQLSLARAHRLGLAVTPVREPWLDDSLPALLRLNGRRVEDDDWSAAVRHWVGLVDQERDVRGLPRHTLTLAARLFGGGEVHADLSPVAFANVAAALDAWTDDPDPTDAPYQRGLGERRADALDDLARHSLHHTDDDLDPDTDDPEFEDIAAQDTFDGFCPTDTLDEQLDTEDEDGDVLVAIRRRLRRAEQHRRRRARRRVRARSGICVNVHVDLRTIAGIRDHEDLDDLLLRGEGWNLTRQAAEQLACDATWVATLFDGPGHVLDANDAAEHWSPKQRRTIAARDAHCVFPSCTRPPRHCDIHHLDHRSRGGPTRTSNGALLCRFHHRLLHHGWHLTIHDGHWVATDPHGTTWTGRPTRGDPP
jgi:hypothetical protein